MRKAFSEDHVYDQYRARGTDENMDKRPERTWDYVVLDLPHCLGVAVQSSRLRDRMTILDKCDVQHIVKEKSCISKFMVTNIPFAQSLGGFQDFVIVNAHLHNEVAKKCTNVREDFMERLLYVTCRSGMIDPICMWICVETYVLIYTYRWVNKYFGVYQSQHTCDKHWRPTFVGCIYVWIDFSV